MIPNKRVRPAHWQLSSALYQLGMEGTHLLGGDPSPKDAHLALPLTVFKRQAKMELFRRCINEIVLKLPCLIA